MSDIGERVKKIVVEHLGVEADKVIDSASFIDDLGADSLDTVELVMAFEEEFGCEIPDDAAEKILTIKDAIDYIQGLETLARVRQRCRLIVAVPCCLTRLPTCHEAHRYHRHGARHAARLRRRTLLGTSD